MATTAAEITGCHAAFLDAAHNFAGGIPAIHEVLRRQGLVPGIGCLHPALGLSPGQAGQSDRVASACPRLNDNAFVAEHLDESLAA